MTTLRVVHYLNQFFAGIGAEDRADTPPGHREGPVGPGRLLQQALGDRAESGADARYRIRNGYASGRRSKQGRGRSRDGLTDLRAPVRRGHEPGQATESFKLLRAGLGLLIEASILKTNRRLRCERRGDRHIFR